MSTQAQRIAAIETDWQTNPRWQGVTRPYTAADVDRLRGTLLQEYTLATHGAKKLWKLMHDTPYVHALGALTGNQAMQQVKAGLKAIYLSGWQVAADANQAGEMYPDQSLYPANSVPQVVRRINNTLARADQINHSEGDDSIDFYAPIGCAHAQKAGRATDDFGKVDPVVIDCEPLCFDGLKITQIIDQPEHMA